jgi:outer membrane protein TolC
VPQLDITISPGLWRSRLEHAQSTRESLAHIVNKALAEYLQVSHHTFHRVSTSTALVEGIYQGALRVGTLREHGDLGLGTFYPSPISSARFSRISQDRLLHNRYNHYRRNFWRRLHWPRRAKVEKRRGPGKRVSDEICPVKRSEGGSDPLRIQEDLTLPTQTIIARRPRVGLKLLGFLLLASPPGCSHERYSYQESLAQRILPPMNIDVHEELPTPKKMAQEPSGGSPARLGPPRAADVTDLKEGKLLSPAQGSVVACGPTQTLTLAEAIDTAFRQQPRLRVYLESVEQARRGEDIAFAPFLPMAAAGYSVGGFDLNVGGNSTPLGPIPGFTFLPAIGSIPFGLNIDTGYELAEIKLQWLICDFGRRLGRYRQAGLAVDIAQLQSERAFQTVANEVAVAYYQVLRTRALTKTAQDAVRRGEDDLDVAKKLEKGGALEKEKRLRVEVQLAESRRLLDAAEGAEVVAVAALNLAIGLNVNAPTSVVETSDVLPFTQSLTECLQTAVGLRREFQVARESIQVADEGRRVAKADFAPRIVAEGYANDFQQAAPRGHADLAVGFIKLEWGLFEGGKRVAELGVADSKIRGAMAQAESIADTIAFQVTEAYRNLITARLAIDRSRPAVAQAEENYRLVRLRAKVGDATSSEITDAESTLTRAQQAYLNSIHDYLIALARLQYAMGVTPTTGGSPGHRQVGRP